MRLLKKGETEIVDGFGLYTHTIYVGNHKVDVKRGDTAWAVNGKKVFVAPGKRSIETTSMCVVLRGYNCPYRSSSINGSDTNLPYINGCSTDQLIHPIRPGDPTLQKLTIPPHASEQKHHIHSTARVVYVYEGQGWSIIGMKGEEKHLLEEGDVIILDKMEPHHFETEDSSLTVIPFHVYSSTPLEHNHAMKLGTHEV